MAKILVTEEQFQMLMKRITEEAAGYDDYSVMAQHGGKSMGVLIDTLSDLSNVLRGIVNITNSSNIEYIDLKENLETAIELISEITQIMKIVFKDFTERKTIRKGEILHRKLESYQEKIRTMINMGEELLSKESLIYRLSELTENVSKYAADYATELESSHKRFSKRLNIGKPRPKTDWN
jgi:uncharacterized phage infection (PIP) family protein YhgE